MGSSCIEAKSKYSLEGHLYAEMNAITLTFCDIKAVMAKMNDKQEGLDDSEGAKKVPRICLGGAAGSVRTEGAALVEQNLGTFLLHQMKLMSSSSSNINTISVEMLP